MIATRSIMEENFPRENSHLLGKIARQISPTFTVQDVIHRLSHIYENLALQDAHTEGASEYIENAYVNPNVRLSKQARIAHGLYEMIVVMCPDCDGIDQANLIFNPMDNESSPAIIAGLEHILQNVTEKCRNMIDKKSSE